MIEIIILLFFLVIQFLILIHQGTIQKQMIQSFLDYQTEVSLQMEMIINDLKNK